MWNSINSDVATSLNQLGPANLPFINGAQTSQIFTKVQTANFAAAAGDIAVFAIASILPPSVTTYNVVSLRIGNAQGNLNSSTVSLYTAASGGGTVVIASTVVNITTSLPSNTVSYQVIGGNAAIMWNSASLFLHITTSTATSNLANVSLAIIPVY